MKDRRRLWGVLLSAFALGLIFMSWHQHLNWNAAFLFAIGILVLFLPERMWNRYRNVQQRNETREQTFFEKYQSAKSREVWTRWFFVGAAVSGAAWTYFALEEFPEIGADWILAGSFAFIGLGLVPWVYSDIKKNKAMRNETFDD